MCEPAGKESGLPIEAGDRGVIPDNVVRLLYLCVQGELSANDFFDQGICQSAIFT
jgi:hypothetical protein